MILTAKAIKKYPLTGSKLSKKFSQEEKTKKFYQKKKFLNIGLELIDSTFP